METNSMHFGMDPKLPTEFRRSTECMEILIENAEIRRSYILCECQDHSWLLQRASKSLDLTCGVSRLICFNHSSVNIRYCRQVIYDLSHVGAPRYRWMRIRTLHVKNVLRLFVMRHVSELTQIDAHLTTRVLTHRIFEARIIQDLTLLVY